MAVTINGTTGIITPDIGVDGSTLVVDSVNNRIGIKTDSPAYALDLGEESSTIRLVSENNGTAIRVGTGGNGSNDVTLLRVDGAGGQHDGESNSSAIGFSVRYMGTRNGNNNSLSIFGDNVTAGTQVEAITINQDGSTGIGTDNPSERLHVKDGILKVETTNQDAVKVLCTDTSQYASARIHLSTTGTATDNVTALVHGNNDAGGTESYFAIETKDSSHAYIKTLALYKNDNGDSDSDSWSFNSGTLGRTRIRIQGNGNVGIGNTDPQQLLHVMPFLEGTTSAYVRVTAGDRGASTGIDVGHDATGNGHVNVVSNGHLDLSTNNTPRVEISNTGFVGIGIDPTSPGLTENHMLRLRSSAASVRGCAIEQPVATDYAEMRFVNDTADIRVGYGGSSAGSSAFQDKFYLYTPSTNKQLITADREGRVHKPNNPGFDAYNGPTDITGGVMVYTQTTSNVGNHYSISTGRFTAPVAGMYHFTNTSYRYDDSADGVVYVRVNGGNYIESRKKSNGAVGWMQHNISIYINLSVGDYVDLYANNRTHNNTTFSRFQGVLVQ